MIAASVRSNSVTNYHNGDSIPGTLLHLMLCNSRIYHKSKYMNNVCFQYCMSDISGVFISLNSGHSFLEH